MRIASSQHDSASPSSCPGRYVPAFVPHHRTGAIGETTTHPLAHPVHGLEVPPSLARPNGARRRRRSNHCKCLMAHLVSLLAHQRFGGFLPANLLLPLPSLAEKPGSDP